MIKAFPIFLTFCCTSFFFFPFFPAVLPTVNTKMIMAACGLVALCFELAKKGSGKISVDLLSLSVMAFTVSGASLLSMLINDSRDNSYLMYFISMWVWLGAGYFMTWMIRWAHGKVSIELVCYYLIAVGAIQCIMAITGNLVPAFQNIKDSLMSNDTGFMGTGKGRLHGLGCALDVAGGRFAAILLMIAFLLPKATANTNNKLFWLLMTAYCIIAMIGNMIGRTCIVGVALSIAYFIYVSSIGNVLPFYTKAVFSKRVFSFIALAFVLGVILYNTNAQWQKNIRFGFEGPISLYETGKWEVKSNDMLMDGYKWPDNLHTWIIGDGYMASTSVDAYYVGMNTDYWYAGTDAGYCRFIFYFGLVGMTAFSLFMLTATCICCRKFPNYSILFLSFFTLNMIVWVKVSTDLFLVFAPFLCISRKDQKKYLLEQDEWEDEEYEEIETQELEHQESKNSLCHI